MGFVFHLQSDCAPPPYRNGCLVPPTAPSGLGLGRGPESPQRGLPGTRTFPCHMQIRQEAVGVPRGSRETGWPSEVETQCWSAEDTSGAQAQPSWAQDKKPLSG